MEIDEIIAGLADQAKECLTHVTCGDDFDMAHIDAAHFQLEAAVLLHNQKIVLDSQQKSNLPLSGDLAEFKQMEMDEAVKRIRDTVCGVSESIVKCVRAKKRRLPRDNHIR